MRYAPPGFCLNDFEIYRKDGVYHLIHLQGAPVHPFDAARLETSYGHATSRDLISWEPKAPVFGITRFPHFDDSAIWTMSIIEHRNKLWMFYTGLSQEPFLRQQIGLAIDESLTCTGWQRFSDKPVVSADPAFYQTTGFMGWRDPFVIFDDETDQWIMYICARSATGNEDKNGCIGAAVSKDLIDWTVIEPVLAPGTYREMECPVLFRHDNRWYLLVSVGDDRTIHTYRSQHALGPFEHLGPLAPAYNYAPRVCTAPNGEPVLLHTVPQKWQAVDSGEYMRGKLAQPKTLIFDENGTPSPGWYAPTEDLYQPLPNSDVIINGMILFTAPENAAGYRCSIRAEDKTGVELVYDEPELTLQYREDGFRLASKTCRPTGKASEVRIVFHDEYYEVYLNGILELTALGYRHTTGTCGVTIDEKVGSFSLFSFRQ